MSDDELVDVIDLNRCKTGEVCRRGDLGKLHKIFLSVHIWIVNSQNQFLLQKRSLSKKADPGKWSITGGVVDHGESSLQVCLREAFEEIGLQLKETEPELIFQTAEPDDWGSLIDVYLVRKDLDTAQIKIQEEELSDVRWVSSADLQKLIDNDEMSEMVLFALPAVLAKSGC